MMKWGRSILFLFLGSLFSVAPNSLHAAEQLHLTTNQKIAAVAGCAATIFGVGYWLGKQTKRKEFTAEELKELALKKGMSTLNPSLRQKIHDYNGWAMKVRRDRQALAPAVLAPVGKWVNASLTIKCLVDECERQNSKAEGMIDQMIRSRSIKNPFATFALHLSMPEGITKNYDNLAHQVLSKLDVIAKPRLIIGRPLNPEECLVVAFSDGDIQILYSDSDRQTLNELSGEQINLIKCLHGCKEHRPKLNGQQQRVFYYLPDQVKDKLSKNFGISKDLTPPLLPTISAKISDQNKKILQNIAAFAALGFGIYRAIKSQSTAEAVIRMLGTGGLLIQNAFSLIDSYYEGSWSNAWKLSLLGQLAIETILLGARMNNPIPYLARRFTALAGKKA